MKTDPSFSLLMNYANVSIAKLDSGMNLTFKRKLPTLTSGYIKEEELSGMILETIRYTMDMFNYTMDKEWEMNDLCSIQIQQTESISITSKIVNLKNTRVLTLFLGARNNASHAAELFWQFPLHGPLREVNSLN